MKTLILSLYLVLSAGLAHGELRTAHVDGADADSLEHIFRDLGRSASVGNPLTGGLLSSYMPASFDELSFKCTNMV